MKIVKVEIENFKPYTKVLLPDNNNNQEPQLPEGLFLIQGNNSMGKTSLIQGMLWGLLGDGLMNDQKRKTLVKAGESSCKVDIIFELGGTIYRIIRKLIIKKSKTPGNEIDFNEEAVLSKKDNTDNKFVTIVNRSKPVNEEVERMLGVGADVVERTVYIRQKDVDRLALADPTQLRQLITTLFGLDEFDRVKRDLEKMRSDLQDSINVLKGEIGGLDSEKIELAKKRGELEIEEKECEQADSDVKTSTDELSNLPSEDILIKIKTNESEINTKNNELALVNNSVSEKRNYIENQTQRIQSLEMTISTLKDKKDHAKHRLESLPPKDNLRRLDGLLSDIRTYENQIKIVVNRSSITLDFVPVSYLEQVNEQLKKISHEIESLKKRKDDAHNTVENLNQILTSIEVLSGIKKKGIKYIEEQEKCPVCDKPIENKEKMIVSIDQEITDIERNYTNTSSQAEKAINEHIKMDREIEAKNKIQNVLESLLTLTSDLENRRQILQSLLDEYSLKSIEDFLSRTSFSTIEDIILEVTRLELERVNFDNNIQIQQDQIRKENEQYKSYEEALLQLGNQLQNIISSIDDLKNNLQEYLQELSTSSLNELLDRFQCKGIDELIIKRKSVENGLKDKEKLLGILRGQILSLTEDIKNREANITKLSQKKVTMSEKENELQHVKYLRGEIDGFISNYVVERKMVGVLRQTTNYYLTQLTEGRYTIDNISSTMRRVRGGMESHGLEITLMDSKDDMIKNKDQLSGGDETALGLALRIAISKLMARIRPFKNSEKRPPIINSIIMDEPMASLDSCRRRILVNMLTEDKSFKQIFLVTHTDIEFGDCHSIMVNEDGNGKRQIDYKRIQL